MHNSTPRRRRRDTGYTTVAELTAALAHFGHPPPRTPFDLPAVLLVQEHRDGNLRHHSLQFLPAAQSVLLMHLNLSTEDGEETVEWLAKEVGWAYYEEWGYANRYTYRDLVKALRLLARFDPAESLPRLPPAFLEAAKSSERRRRAGTLMPEGVRPRPQDLEHDVDAASAAWAAPHSTTEVIGLADDLYRAVRRRRPSNWEELARRVQWDPLWKATINVAVRLWVEQLKRPASATKPLLAFSIELLRLVDHTFPRSLDEGIVEGIRNRIQKALMSCRG